MERVKLMRRKYFYCLNFITALLIFTSCQIMPVEEELPEPPVIRSYEAKKNKQTTVLRGDLITSETVKCTYASAKQEALSFSQEGLRIEKIYVSVGQQVKTGELLAELELGDLPQQIESGEYEIAALNTKRAYILKIMELEQKKQDILIADMEDWLAREQEKEKDRIAAAYNRRLQEVDDSLYIAGLRMEELQDELRQRRIYAGISGTVTYVQKMGDDERSTEGRTFIKIADMDTNVFIVKGENAQYFPEGKKVTIQCDKKEFTAYAVDGTGLGMPKSKESEIAYLKPEPADTIPENGAEGTIKVILEERRDVLYVNKKAVKTSEGEQFVYMLNDEGMRYMNKVTTGFSSGNFVEITSGLAEGDSVIMY